MAYIIGALIGAGLSCLAFWLLRTGKVIGNLRVDQSDPSDKPYLFLELNTDISAVMRRRYVTLRVHIENFLPHD